MKNRIVVSLTFIAATALSLTLADPWDGYNSPEKMGRGRYEYDFQKLPKSGEISNEKLPWSDTYFPTFKGGIAYRWQLGNPSTSWNYELHTREELKTLPVSYIAKLSPAEKFDIWQGDYTYPTVRSERARTSPKSATWAGLCHGWGPASILHREPSAKTVTNRDGITIPFGSSDIKAVLTYYYGKVDWKPTGWTGRKCRSSFGGKGCKGVNPATLHPVMTNQIGLLDEAFIMDRDRKLQIWNQPFFAYSYKNLGSCSISRRSARAGASYGVLVSMRAKWADELDHSLVKPAMKKNSEGKWVTRHKESTFQYCLELSPSGRIVGGEWEGKIRPGFIWNHEMADFADPYYGRIRELLNDESHPMPEAEPAETAASAQ